MASSTFRITGFATRPAGWLLTEATDVNDSGQIVGYGLRRGELHGFLLSPNLKQ